jgi:hypothetical protein
MPGMPMTFHLAPPVDRESTQPALEHGRIKSITWNESYRPKPADASPPPVMVESPPPVMVELPARLYSMLGAIVAIGVFIAVMLFLRR